MKIVIDIPDEAYKTLLEEQRVPTGLDLEYLVMHGTPIPKGCGSLIDGDALRNEMIQTFKKYCNANAWDVCVECVRRADTIIEADKEGEE